ncbi:MAG: hypothetical protein AAFN07_14500 [Pseudomonadota bacterium]
MIFAKLRRPKVRALYLGAITVVPKSELNEQEQAFVWSKLDPVAIIEYEIRDIFQLPPITNAQEPGKGDIGVDVFVSDFRLGALNDVWAFPLSIPLVWRPRIELRARLFNLMTSETVSEFSATARMPLSQFIRRTLHPAALFHIRPTATQNDLIRLTQEASIAVLEKIRKWHP